ncbi:hypothetical protein C8R42DRAFT_743981 [Lentinula raphanica]|nr:hypothetical protein C8R42DRAFT_743981 [Lentinula raphanica]
MAWMMWISFPFGSALDEHLIEAQRQNHSLIMEKAALLVEEYTQEVLQNPDCATSLDCLIPAVHRPEDYTQELSQNLDCATFLDESESTTSRVFLENSHGLIPAIDQPEDHTQELSQNLDCTTFLDESESTTSRIFSENLYHVDAQQSAFMTPPPSPDGLIPAIKQAEDHIRELSENLGCATLLDESELTTTKIFSENFYHVDARRSVFTTLPSPGGLIPAVDQPETYTQVLAQNLDYATFSDESKSTTSRIFLVTIGIVDTKGKRRIKWEIVVDVKQDVNYDLSEWIQTQNYAYRIVSADDSAQYMILESLMPNIHLEHTFQILSHSQFTSSPNVHSLAHPSDHGPLSNFKHTLV